VRVRVRVRVYMCVCGHTCAYMCTYICMSKTQIHVYNNSQLQDPPYIYITLIT